MGRTPGAQRAGWLGLFCSWSLGAAGGAGGPWGHVVLGPQVRRELMGKRLFSFTYKYDERGSIEEIS